MNVVHTDKSWVNMGTADGNMWKNKTMKTPKQAAEARILYW
jgi:hypothetical protein